MPSSPVTNELPTVLMDVTRERQRQIELGWTPDHDDRHRWEDMVNLVDVHLAEADDPGTAARRREEAIQAIAVLCAAVEAHDRQEARRV